MFNPNKKANIGVVYFMLLIMSVINSKEIMHSFVWHDAFGCVAHYDEDGHITTHETVSETGAFCAFCHVDFSIYSTPDQQTITASNFQHHQFVELMPDMPLLPSSSDALQLRGPPAFA